MDNIKTLVLLMVVLLLAGVTILMMFTKERKMLMYGEFTRKYYEELKDHHYHLRYDAYDKYKEYYENFCEKEFDINSVIENLLNENI